MRVPWVSHSRLIVVEHVEAIWGAEIAGLDIAGLE